MPKVLEEKSRRGLLNLANVLVCFQFSPVVSAGVFHNHIAAGLWSEKKHQSERQLFFSNSAKMSRPVSAQATLTHKAPREPSSQDTDVLPLTSTSVSAEMGPRAGSYLV